MIKPYSSQQIQSNLKETSFTTPPATAWRGSTPGITKTFMYEPLGKVMTVKKQGGHFSDFLFNPLNQCA